ncbi:MAG: DUF1064 domain-containing protein [Hyphomicrobiales bacterium]
MPRFSSRNSGFSRASRHWVCRKCRASSSFKIKTCVCGNATFWTFDSRVEYDRWRALSLLEHDGAISELTPKDVFPLVLYDRAGVEVELFNRKGRFYRHIPKYVCDFAYMENGVQVVEDVKPKDPRADTPEFKLKARIFAVLYGFEVTIVRP